MKKRPAVVLGGLLIADGSGWPDPRRVRYATAEQAFAMLARGGVANVIGMIPVGTKIELDGYEFLGEKRIQGSFMGSNRFPIDLPRFVDFYMQGKLRLDQMVSRRIRLDQVNEAFDELKRGELARSVILFDA